ncbi:hypothetical protein C0Z16_21515 [Paraburkholderia rhynchosiae]|uniref:Uncharacterized protein n=1 Tax=Paraburkholderia rhynchosiae TaxID=487049 RepID=A0ABX4V1H2_9BURK|nr:hypothetical protein C0Z16_21515 [Paraburkholderia rhynchosiae]
MAPSRIAERRIHAIDHVDVMSRIHRDDGIVSLTLHFVHPHDAAACGASFNCGAHVSFLQWTDVYTR